MAGFDIISKPLTILLKKDQLFVWTDTTQKSFEALKDALVKAPVLVIPDFAKTFVIETDASGVGIGAVLQQDGHPIAYISKLWVPGMLLCQHMRRSAWRYFLQLIIGDLICNMLSFSLKSTNKV